jgi:hypothetical protein
MVGESGARGRCLAGDSPPTGGRGLKLNRTLFEAEPNAQ